jgi:hypothetical protein
MLEVNDFSALENMVVYSPARRSFGNAASASWNGMEDGGGCGDANAQSEACQLEVQMRLEGQRI